MTKDEKTSAATPAGPITLDAEGRRRQRARNIAIALALLAMVALFYAATLVRLGANVMNRPI